MIFCPAFPKIENPQKGPFNSYFLAAKYLLSKILERTDWINKELKGESNQQVMRRRASLGCRVAGNDAGVWGAEAQK